MPDRSGFATTTIGPPFWGERLGATLATLRLSRQPLTPLAAALEGTVRVRGTVRAITDPAPAPVSGRPAVFGRLIGCVEERGRSVTGSEQYFLRVRTDVTFGGSFCLEDETGRGRVEIGADDPFELFVLVRRLGPWNRAERLPHLEAFSRLHPNAMLALEETGAVYGEWAIEEGQTLSVIADVVGLDAAPDDRDYRGVRRLPVLGPRRQRPILLFE